MSQNSFSKLPSVSKILELSSLSQARQAFPHDTVLSAVRAEIDSLRQQIVAGSPVDLEEPGLVSRILDRIAHQTRPRLRRVINATGIVLHTNLGRSPMPESAAEAAYEAARGYLNLELDLETGKRSSRQLAVHDAICKITGAESATVVNNCAAATVIVLRAIAAGKEVVVSRGQLIEIGGSFRIPDILTVSGATLHEVGTTNITRLSDFERAIGPRTGALMRIHTSNYRVRGFTESVPIEDLVALGRKHSIPVIDDIGSGAVVDLNRFGLEGEPTVSEGARAGADLVLFSGDKLLGGPQVGIIAGRSQWISAIEKDPMMRAFRLDKMSLAALEATLRIYADPERAVEEIPTLRMLTTPIETLRARSEKLRERLSELGTCSVIDDITYVGGGSLPDVAIPTVVLRFVPTGGSLDEFARKLRLGEPAVMARIQNLAFLIDLRTVFDWQEDLLVDAIQAAVR